MNQKRLLTWILLGAGGALTVFAGLLTYVALTFDVNDYKDRVSKEVATRYHRTLTINGDLSFSVFPNVEITLPYTSLSEPNTKEIAAEVREARVTLALMPLIHKEVKIGKIVLDSLKTVIIKDKTGKSNFDDLLGPPDKTEAQQIPEPSSTQAQMINFDVDGILISNSSFTYRDLGTGKEMILSQVELKVGRLAAKSTVPLELSLHYDSKDPAIQAQLTMNGNITLDLLNKRYIADTLALTFDGTIDNAPLSSQVDISGLDWTISAFKAKSLHAVAKRGEPDSTEITLSLTGADGSPSSVNIDQFTGTIQAKTTATGRNITIAIKSPLAANLDTRAITVKALEGQVKVEDPTSVAKLIELALTGAIDANLREEKVTGKIAITMDESKIDSRFDVANFTKPVIGFDLDIDTINVDRYTGQETPVKGAEEQTADQPAKETPIDLSALKGFSLDGGIRIGTLQVHGIKAREISLKLLLNNGELLVNPLAATLYDGLLNTKASINANTNHFAFSPKLTAIQVGPLLRDAAKLDKMEGKGDVAFEVTAQGTLFSAIKKSLAGKGSVNLTDGEIKGFDYAKRLAGWREKLTNLGAAGASNEGVASSVDEKTLFSELTATFIIDKGVATNHDLSLKAPLVRLGGDGSIDIGNDSLDYTVNGSVVSTLTGQGGKEIGQTKDITIPVRVHGPFNKISYNIQWAAVSSIALKSMVAPKIEEQKKMIQEKVQGKAQEKIKGSLQGLFKR